MGTVARKTHRGRYLDPEEHLHLTVCCPCGGVRILPAAASPYAMAYPRYYKRATSDSRYPLFRIMAPDESILILKQQSGVLDEPQQQQQPSQRSKILRRKSSRREKDIINPPPMVITPPVLLNRAQSCSLCCREKSRVVAISDD
ncbi:hypothetical protein Y032_0284g1343 [Ancylostoma ceylanicum]|uniref:Uncharacterized protein n=1 Tax=Ancylostoma ceylanicum TaxID=53326 RepID=A0A016S7D8_9BILA|nr:hypothetical protein Y032_0284g1343 [Ancylostoma ceylanicum]